MTRPTALRARRAFTLLEVMIATAILVVTLVILTETQATAVQMTLEAERIQIATQLAQAKLAEVQLLVEREGFPQGSDLTDKGDFDDFGNEVLNLQFGDDLEDFHWEYLVQEIDLELAGDLLGTINQLTGQFGGDNATGAQDMEIPGVGGMDALSAFVSPEMITDLLDPYLREVRVVVWWGDDVEEAEELGNQVELVQHISVPGRMKLQDPTLSNGQNTSDQNNTGNTTNNNGSGGGGGGGRPAPRAATGGGRR